MKRLLVACSLSAFLLAGCTSTTFNDSLTQVCGAGDTAYAVYVAAGVGSAKDHQTIDAAYAALKNVCANKDTATPETLLVDAAAAYAAITQAIKNSH